MNYWLVKSEADCYSIDDLKKDKKTMWDGVRNYQARNFMMNGMQKGDLVIFYHSNATPSAAVGIAKVASKPYPDPTQFDPKEDHYDPKADLDRPRWYLVDMAFVKKFKRPVSLADIKADPALRNMEIARRGSRLSVTPVTAKEFERIEELGEQTS